MTEPDAYEGLAHRFCYIDGLVFTNEDGGGNAACMEEAQKKIGLTFYTDILEKNNLVQGAYGFDGEGVVAYLWASGDSPVPVPTGLEDEAKAKFATKVNSPVRWLAPR